MIVVFSSEWESAAAFSYGSDGAGGLSMSVSLSLMSGARVSSADGGLLSANVPSLISGGASETLIPRLSTRLSS